MIGLPIGKRALARLKNEIIAELSQKLSADLERLVQDKMSQVSGGLGASSPDNISQSLQASLDARIAAAISSRMYLPNLSSSATPGTGRFMPYSTCSSADFLHPRYAEICAMFRQPPVFHRKVWEWVFVIHKLLEAGVIGEGKRGLVFGVGQERLPSLFASLGASIVATDAPESIGVGAGWSSSNEYSNSLEQLRFRDLVSDEVFDKKVRHRYCDMNAISPDLTGFDFVWSSCCFEHLGSLEAGIQFVINSVENTLKAGGVACHTTEFNLSSDEDTLSEGGTVIYRRRDMLELVERLRARGHEVEPFVMAPDSHYIDHHIDVPPFTHNPHLKLRLGQYVATSVGIAVRRR